MDFSNVIIMTDLDGTLLDDKKNISQRDMAAIDDFCAKGGKFTIATGRGYSMAKPVADKLKLSMPAVIFNGSAVYDFTDESFLWQSEVTYRARGYIKEIIKNFPDVGIEVLHKHTVYVPSNNDVERMHMALENVKGVICDIDDIPDGGWLKVLIAYPEDKMPKIRAFIDENCCEGTNRVLSAPFFYELLPTGVSKAYGYKKLLELTGNTHRFTVAAGDYPNDAEMVRSADLGVAVENAHDEVKKAANIIIGTNNDDPMTHIIEHIASL